ncbi:MAG: hotdog fold thioesterase [Rhodothermales bacterium]
MSDGTSIWTGHVDLTKATELARGTMIEHLGIEYTELGPDFLRGTMPVDGRTIRPFGILHGGASVALAETLGSMAANLCVDRSTQMCVGLDISANHVRQVTEGMVTGTARPLHLGGSTQVWEIRIDDEAGRLVSVSRLTMIVLDRERQ